MCVLTEIVGRTRWAWQNSHMTRHIPADQRLAEARVVSRVNSKSGRVRRRPTRPILGLTGHLANLQLLLRAESFRPWPLEVRFFCEDVHRAWCARTERVAPALRDGVEVVLDVDSATGGVERLEIGYQSSKQHLQKSVRILNQDRDLVCDVCRSSVDRTGSVVTLTCPHGRCRSVSHLTCLAGHFIRSSAGADADAAETAILPTRGSCPRCKKAVRWIDLVKEASLRERGDKDLAKLLAVRHDKKSSKKKTNKKSTKNPPTEVLADDDDDAACDTQIPSSSASDLSEDETLPASQDVLACSAFADDGFLVLQSSSEAGSVAGGASADDGFLVLQPSSEDGSCDEYF